MTVKGDQDARRRPPAQTVVQQSGGHDARDGHDDRSHATRSSSPISRLSNSSTSLSAWFGHAFSASIRPLASVTSTGSIDASQPQVTTWHVSVPSPTLLLALISVPPEWCVERGAA